MSTVFAVLAAVLSPAVLFAVAEWLKRRGYSGLRPGEPRSRARLAPAATDLAALGRQVVAEVTNPSRHHLTVVMQLHAERPLAARRASRRHLGTGAELRRYWELGASELGVVAPGASGAWGLHPGATLAGRRVILSVVSHLPGRTWIDEHPVDLRPGRPAVSSGRRTGPSARRGANRGAVDL